jgi:hypothetical protein
LPPAGHRAEWEVPSHTDHIEIIRHFNNRTVTG